MRDHEKSNAYIKQKFKGKLVGPSGCGKSTTLRMVAGLEEISSGELYIDGKLMNDVAPKDRDIAMVFQNYALYPHMTVYENMAFPLKLRKRPKSEIDKAVREAAEILDITQYLDRKPKALSGGQRQRVAIGRAIVREPKILLMDEPASALDPISTSKIEDLIYELKKEYTIVIVTHNMQQAVRISDHTAFFLLGELVEYGETEKLFSQPQDKRTEDYITGRFG